MRPVEFDAHVQLCECSASQYELLPHRQPYIVGGQGEVINLVSCGKRREDSKSTHYCSPETTDSLCTNTLSNRVLVQRVFHLTKSKLEFLVSFGVIQLEKVTYRCFYSHSIDN